MMIRTIHKDKRTERVKESDLQPLIRRGDVAAFYRDDGRVSVDKGPIRGEGGTYAGPNRREAEEEYESDRISIALGL
jgi:hypothetical protein